MVKFNKVISESEAGEKVDFKKRHLEIRFTSSIKVAKDIKEINILKICN